MNYTDVTDVMRQSLSDFGYALLPDFIPEVDREALLLSCNEVEHFKHYNDLETCPIAQYSATKILPSTHVEYIKKFELWLATQFSLPSGLATSAYLLKFQNSDYGISKHQDGSALRFLGVNFYLSGNGNFLIYPEDGSTPHQIDVSPGNALLTTAKGYERWKNTPWHSIENITDGPRYNIALKWTYYKG